MLALLNIGPFELLLLGAAAVLLFGGDLPDVARKAARMAGRLRAMTSELTRELRGPDDLRRELRRPAELDLDLSARRVSPAAWRPVSQSPPEQTAAGSTSVKTEDETTPPAAEHEDRPDGTRASEGEHEGQDSEPS